MNTLQAILEAPPRRKFVNARPRVEGKFLFVGEEKFWVRGISYGTFQIDENGEERLSREMVERDFAQMAENGFNVVRVHTGPPRWLLDVAQKNGLRVMVGLNWGEQMAFLDQSDRRDEIEAKVRRWIRRCSGHPAVFCYSIGNEITSSIVRWHGRRQVEKFIQHLYHAAKQEDPDALVTYVNYPSTEYLRLPFLDFLSFNVYLESRQAFEDYLSRLHNLSDDRPVLLSETGLDSLRNGEEKQASTLEWQVRAVFKQGCCGVIVFAWTDEWYHGKHLVEDWKFGLTTRDRTPKPALRAVRQAFQESPFPPGINWPRISVVVCSYNGASTIRDTLDGLQKLDYPGLETIVVDDGSTDSTAQIASEYPVQLIRNKNGGLSQARNTGIHAATGEIVAFIDDDAYPDIHWLKFLAKTIIEGKYVGVGGPNLPPPSDGWKADAVANSPGNPNVVLLTDNIAEHIPGVNMMFRKDALNKIGGFDPVFRAAGDDVDLCWRLREAGGTIGFSPAAIVWHHRRNSIRKFWRQQVGYGRAEGLLERKWPEKYNSASQVSWQGRIYGKGLPLDLASFRGRVYQGVWGSAPFQSLYQAPPSRWSLTLSPEWYLVIGALAIGFVLSLGWSASSIFGLLILTSLALPISQAWMNACQAKFPDRLRKGLWQALRLRATVFALHLLQPLARLEGRLKVGLTPWRRYGTEARIQLRTSRLTMWRDRRESLEDTLENLQRQLREASAVVIAGGDYDRWDLEVRGGLFGGGRLLAAVEEHAPGKQFLHFRVTPKYYSLAILLATVSTLMSIIAGLSGAWIPSATWALMAILVAIRALGDAGSAADTLRETVKWFGAS
ncbi:glycosyltransferase [Candidatus Bathyarchaeota archaeon]|nr:MAG: glycosyltransferase [Candidatus Bathyarchaeota archaeon]